MPSNKYISDEQLAAFIDGELSAAVMEAMTESPKLLEEFRIASMAANLIDEVEPQNIPFHHGQPELHCFNPCFSIAESGPCQQSDICAIKSEQLILSHFGIEVPTEDLVSLSSEKGWYSEGKGTSIGCVGNLLEHCGLKVERRQGATIDEVREELLAGGKVMLCIDAGELIGDPGEEYYEDIFMGEIADHAVVVVGIDDNGKVVIYDPATPELIDSYPFDRFIDAWQDSGCYLIVAKMKNNFEK